MTKIGDPYNGAHIVGLPTPIRWGHTSTLRMHDFLVEALTSCKEIVPFNMQHNAEVVLPPGPLTTLQTLGPLGFSKASRVDFPALLPHGFARMMHNCILHGCYLHLTLRMLLIFFAKLTKCRRPPGMFRAATEGQADRETATLSLWSSWLLVKKLNSSFHVKELSILYFL